MPNVGLFTERTISGDFTSPVIAVPPGINGRVSFAANIASADLLDPSKSMQFDIYKSLDGGSTWQFEAGFTWEGGDNPVPGTSVTPSPSLSFPASDVAGCDVQIRVNIPQPLTLSASMSY